MNQAIDIMKKLLALKALFPVVLLAWLWAGASPDAQAANGQCRWEGGPGADGGHSYCAMEDCIGTGGFAQCSRAEGAARSSSQEPHLGPDKWVYGACDHFAPHMANIALWCVSAGGNWEGSQTGCTGLAPGIFSGGASSNADGQTSSIAQRWADGKFGSDCSATVVSDTGWGATLPPSTLCYSGGNANESGILVRSHRKKTYQSTGPSCSGTLSISFLKSRSVQCPAGYKTRLGAEPGAECYIPASACCVKGNPTSPINGAKTQQEVDYRGASGTGLEFTRYYNSAGFYRPTLLTTTAPSNTDMDGSDFWIHSYDRRLYLVSGNAQVIAINRRQDGLVKSFDSAGREQANVNGAAARLVAVPGAGWDLTLADHSVERYDPAGRLASITTRTGLTTTLTYTAEKLTSVTGPFGHALQFAYNADGLLFALTLPGGEVIRYEYDNWKRLVAVDYPARATRSYGYADREHGWLLTSIADDGVGFATYTYDASGRVISSEHAGGAGRHQFEYLASGTIVTDDSGLPAIYTLQNVSGVHRVSGVSQPCADCGPAASTAYDSNGNISATTDFNGVQTLHLYDPVRNLETWRTEAAGTSVERVVTTSWHPAFRSPAQIDEPGRRTSFTYDLQGNLLTRTVTDTATGDSRTWTNTYNSLGQLLTEDGPRDVNDVTTYTYHSCSAGSACGQIATVTNAAGHVTNYLTYNAHGSPLTIADPNGQTTTLAYDVANRLLSRTAGSETTTFEYWPNGPLRKVTGPDGTSTEYQYDAAQRLIGIEDQEGNRIAYTLDAAGNRTREDVYDPSDVLVSTRSARFNALGRKTQDIGAGGQTTVFEYDPAGSLLSTTDPLNRVTLGFYDELRRLSAQVDPVGQSTQFTYSPVGDLASVIDPRQLQTHYALDAFGGVTQLTSPDTGVSTTAFDESGLVAETIDARGRSADYSHDALGRATAIAYGDQTVMFGYDTGPNAIGRRSQATNAASSLAWSYDSQGRVTRKSQIVGAEVRVTSYIYDAVGRLASLTTPSGQLFEYQYANGRLDGIRVNGTQLVSGILYAPFGATRGWQWGNGTYTVREYDLDGRITTIDSAGLANYFYAADGTIQSITDESLPPSSSGTSSLDIAIFGNSNRLESVMELTSRSYTYDAAGNTLADGLRSFAYDDAGRMISATRDGVTTLYSYNALGQRVRKANQGTVEYFVYDESGHLLGAYGPNGVLVEELVWLGDIPIATVRASETGGIGFFYIHTDHLNTPTRITRHTDNAVMWRWDRDPYGNGAPNEDAEGNGRFVFFNLRFPGQQFDPETGLHYNYFRDYDPAVGRYVESDPIGLDGGRNTYAYVLGDPIGSYDALGLKRCEGKWIKFGDHVPELPTPRGNIPLWTCTCYWMCIGCKDSEVMWDGNKYNLPSSKGVTYVDHSGNRPPNVGTGGIGAPKPPTPPAPNGPRGGSSGAMGGAYACMCPKPGSETGCNMCHRGSILPDYIK